jgi:N-acetylglucosaminyl-diphospho-decaprenol L-rhamnosyltransferase
MKTNKMKLPPTLSIVIVNWNAGFQLNDCIQSLRLANQDILKITDIIIVDNGSTDNSLSETAHPDLPLRFIKNEVNLGFAAACNQGATFSTADYLLFLNPDTLLFENSLTLPISFMQKASNAKIGICGIQLVDEHGNPVTSAARFPSLRVMVGKTLGLSNLLPNLFPPHLLTSTDIQTDGKVDQIIGAFFLIRHFVFDMCEGFDERFFVYFEEVDLSLRAKQIGYSSYLILGTSAFHKGGGCSDQVKATRLFYSLRSRLKYAQKHYSVGDFVGFLFLTGIEFFLRIIFNVFKLSWLDIKNTIIAYRLLISYFIRSI